MSRPPYGTDVLVLAMSLLIAFFFLCVMNLEVGAMFFAVLHGRGKNESVYDDISRLRVRNVFLVVFSLYLLPLIVCVLERTPECLFQDVLHCFSALLLLRNG